MKISKLVLLLGLVSSTAAFAANYDVVVSVKGGGSVVYRLSNTPVADPSITVPFDESTKFSLMTDDNGGSSVGRLDVYDSNGQHLLYCNDGQLGMMISQAYLGNISNPIKLNVSGDANHSLARLENGNQVCDGNHK